nr:hypothetical protein [uncultured Flavobacterium sp.]
MIYLEDINIFILIAMGLFCGIIILWAYSLDQKGRRKLHAKGLERELPSKMRYWRTYGSAALGILLISIELVKRLCKHLFI